jgi:hypothetical protein
METAFNRSIVTALGAYLTGSTIFLPVAGKKAVYRAKVRGCSRARPDTSRAYRPTPFLGAIYQAFEIIYLVRYFI